MLHIIAQIDKGIPVYFLDTGYHFPETLAYKKEITHLLGLEVIELRSPVSKIFQRDEHNTLYFAIEPDYCCYLNKTLPMEPVLAENDVWITGVRRDQNANRKTFDYEQEAPRDIIRFHPMLDWTNKMIWQYINLHELPKHPLDDKGYFSVGCEPCTQKFNLEGGERSARWQGLKKTECGLHTDLASSTNKSV